MAELGAGSLLTGDPAFNYQEHELNERLKRLYPAVNEEETPLPRSWSPKDKYSYIGLSQNNLRVHYKGIQMWHTVNCQPIGLDNPGWFAALEYGQSPRSSLSCFFPVPFALLHRRKEECPNGLTFSKTSCQNSASESSLGYKHSWGV